jgi:heme-degrading monooxygenase HmoA
MPMNQPVPTQFPTARRRWLKSLGLGLAATLAGKGLNPRLHAQNPGKSVQLHIYIEVKPGKGLDLENLYHSAYVPAIKVQEGFLSSRLLRQYDSSSKYQIDISFKTEKLRAAWAQSKEHQSAWPRVEELSAKITWQGFDLLA